MSADTRAVLDKWERPVFSVGPITRSDIVRYAGAALDFNPLHHDEIYARKLGHPSVFAHGMFSAGILASFVTLWFGGESIRHFAAKFREIVWPGDTLKAQGDVVSVREDQGTLSIWLDLALLRNGGEVVVEGKARVEVADGQEGAVFTPATPILEG